MYITHIMNIMLIIYIFAHVYVKIVMYDYAS